MINQRILSLVLCTFFLTTLDHLTAQDVQREIGVQAGGLSDFGGVYKWEREDGAWHRLNAGLASITLQTREGFDNIDIGVSVGYGIEKRKQWGDNTQFLHGSIWSIGGDFDHRHFTQGSTELKIQTGSAHAGLSFLVGIQYLASEKFSVGVEFLPGLIATAHFQQNDTRYSLTGTASLDNIAVFGLYRFASPGKE